jgi:hypothetical protein
MTKKSQEAKMEGIQANSEVAKTGLSYFGFQNVWFSRNRLSLIRV